MSSNSNRGVLIDDNAPGISYSGPWNFLETGAGILGTVHGLYPPSGTVGLSVNFTGVSIIGYAITRHGNDSTGTPVPDSVLYTVNCVIDGNTVSNTVVPQMSLFETGVCNSTTILAAGMHTLEITWVFPSPNPNFGYYLDYFLVTPAQNQTIGAQENAMFYAEDPIIQTSIQQANAGWTNKGTWYETSLRGSQFTFQFTGVSIMWYGKRPANSRLLNSTATYTIDGGDPLSFNLGNGTQLAAQPSLFKSQQYPYGNHTLHVVYQGDNGSVPLSLFALIIQRVPTTNAAGVPQTGSTTPTSTDTALPALSTSGPGPATSSSLPSVRSGHHGVNGARIGGIVGGIIGSLAVVAVAAYFLVFRRKRGNVRPPSAILEPSDPINHEELIPDPFPTSRGPSGRGYSKTSATGSPPFPPFHYDTEELHGATGISTPSARYDSSTRASQGSESRIEEGNEISGASCNIREQDSGMRVMRPISSLPPLYTAD